MVIKTLDLDSLEMLDPDLTTLLCLITCAELNNVEKNVKAAVHHQDVLQELPLLHQQGRGYGDSLSQKPTMHMHVYCSVANPDPRIRYYDAGSGFGSVSQYGSPDPDPYQNVTSVTLVYCK